MLEVSDVSKVYQPPPRWLRPLVRTAVKRPVVALRGVSFSVERGELIGLVGPNGAGKTTLIKLITSLLQATSGRITVEGYDVEHQAREVRRRLGLVLEGDQGLYDRLSGRQNLEFYGRLAGMSAPAARQRTQDLLEVAGLEARDKLIFGYSAGMKVRLSIARALMADPALLILDEPTRSLDPVASRSTMQLFQQLAAEGRAVLLSSHRLDEVVLSCSRILAIVHGRLCFHGTVADLADSSTQAADALSDLLEREAAKDQ